MNPNTSPLIAAAVVCLCMLICTSVVLTKIDQASARGTHGAEVLGQADREWQNLRKMYDEEFHDSAEVIARKHDEWMQDRQLCALLRIEALLQK